MHWKYCISCLMLSRLIVFFFTQVLSGVDILHSCSSWEWFVWRSKLRVLSATSDFSLIHSLAINNNGQPLMSATVYQALRITCQLYEGITILAFSFTDEETDVNLLVYVMQNKLPWPRSSSYNFSSRYWGREPCRIIALLSLSFLRDGQTSKLIIHMQYLVC